MSFDPEKHFINLARGGSPRMYLPVSARIAWFRDEHGLDGGISTELLSVDPKPIVKATVWVNGVAIASGTASVPPVKGNETWSGREVEKAETAAVGRALAHAGFGTLNAMMDDDDLDNLADSPAESKTDRLLREIEEERSDKLKTEPSKPTPSSTRHTADPDPSATGASSDTVTFTTNFCYVNTTKAGKPYLSFSDGKDVKASAWTRDKLSALELGEADLKDLTIPDKKFDFASPVVVVAIKDAKGYWQVDSVNWEVPS